MSTAIRDHYLSDFHWNHQFFLYFLDGIPDEKLTYQPTPTDNHTLWQIGHLGTGHVYFQSLVTGEEMKLDERMNKLFGHGSKPTSSRGAYPPVAEVRAWLDGTVKDFDAACKKRDDAALLARISNADDKFVATGIQAIARNCWHIGWHSGQVAGIRKALGLPNKL